ncbi:MAG: hypothetical protein K2W96_25450 [Gemmataceae bacterium]|nr:hypothetical protein [Gemmataceae bacterium]
MPLRKILALSVLSICFCAASWYAATVFFAWVHGHAPASEPPKPTHFDVDGLRVPASALEFGEQWQTDEFKVTLPITNISGKPIRVEQFWPSCLCVRLLTTRLHLEPGETGEVALAIDLTLRDPRERHLAERVFEIGLRPQIEKQPLPKTMWVMRCVARSRITLDTDELVFGGRTLAGTANDPRRLEARVHGSEGELKAKVIPSTAGTASVESAGEGKFKLTLALSSLPEGPFSFAVDLSATGEPAGLLRRFKVKGVMRPEVRAFPAQLFFGPRPVGMVTVSSVQLQSPPGAGWEVERIE